MRIFFGHFCRECNLIVRQWTEHCVHNPPQTVTKTEEYCLRPVFQFFMIVAFKMRCECRMANGKYWNDSAIKWRWHEWSATRRCVTRKSLIENRKKMVEIVSHATHTVNVTRWRAITVLCTHSVLVAVEQSIDKICSTHEFAIVWGTWRMRDLRSVWNHFSFHFFPHFSSASTRPLHIHMDATRFAVQGVRCT